MDKYLERIAVALEMIAGALQTNKQTAVREEITGTLSSEIALPKKAAKKAEKTAEIPVETEAPVKSEKPIVLSEVAEVVRKLASAGVEGHAKAASVLKTYGAARISDLKPEDFPAVIAKIQEILKAK